jgi:hypothetical protein
VRPRTHPRGDASAPVNQLPPSSFSPPVRRNAGPADSESRQGPARGSESRKGGAIAAARTGVGGAVSQEGSAMWAWRGMGWSTWGTGKGVLAQKSRQSCPSLQIRKRAVAVQQTLLPIETVPQLLMRPARWPLRPRLRRTQPLPPSSPIPAPPPFSHHPLPPVSCLLTHAPGPVSHSTASMLAGQGP